ncbi:MAG: carboxypeptidase M32 [Betaproteobacteria bacterium]|nr:carboxypeptidase M32 [Betaproteobacteria bacterium]
MPATPAYASLCATYTRLHHFQHFQSLGMWDGSVNMPPGGNETRASAMAELGLLVHGIETDPKLKGLIDAAEQEPLDDLARANVREIRRRWRHANLLPAELVEAKTIATARCEHAWRTQRETQDWKGFLPNLRAVVALARREARLLGEAQGLSPYDALMDRFEPGVRSAEVERIFGDVKTWLPGFIRTAVERQKADPAPEAKGPFPVERQRALGLAVMKLLGFDFERGRLDVSAHPFCGGVPEDVRITTRYNEDDFAGSFMAVIHETGHARYEQNLPRETVALPVGRARSAGIHESQSLAFEMQVARSPAFLRFIAPVVREHLGDQPAFSDESLIRRYRRVKPDLIRVEADELCYPAHIILRFEIERLLVNGEIETEDIPGLWDAKMADYLGLDTRGNFKDGCMQDVHWAEGLMGYFPSYTLGAMCAAQYFATIRRAVPDLDARIGTGDLRPVFDWLGDNIWRQASRYETDELMRRATGEPLNPAHFRAHLEARYLAS